MKTVRQKELESGILKTILEGLSALRIWHMRCNSGAMFGEYGGQKRMLRFGRRGMADVLALPSKCILTWEAAERVFTPTWLEVKRPGGKQSPDQVAFQAEVEAEGHRYLLVHDWDDVLEALK